MEALLESAARAVFALVCHQDPTILVRTDGRALLLCPRCIGLHLGFASMLCAASAGAIRPSPRLVGFLVVLATLPAIHWALGALGALEAATPGRFATGLAGGAGFAGVTLAWRLGRGRVAVPGWIVQCIAAVMLSSGAAGMVLGRWGAATAFLLGVVILDLLFVWSSIAHLAARRSVSLFTGGWK
jgi:uncharacterized membrane protein